MGRVVVALVGAVVGGLFWVILPGVVENAKAASEAVDVRQTAYDVPRDAIFVAKDGDDQNLGTDAEPLRTLGAAVAKAPADATIVMRAGEYREGVVDIARPLTIQPYPRDAVWLRGGTTLEVEGSAAGTTIRGLGFGGDSSAQNAVRVRAGGVTLEQNVFVDFAGRAVHVSGGTAAITNNTFHGNSTQLALEAAMAARSRSGSDTGSTVQANLFVGTSSTRTLFDVGVSSEGSAQLVATVGGNRVQGTETIQWCASVNPDSCVSYESLDTFAKATGLDFGTSVKPVNLSDSPSSSVPPTDDSIPVIDVSDPKNPGDSAELPDTTDTPGATDGVLQPGTGTLTPTEPGKGNGKDPKTDDKPKTDKDDAKNTGNVGNNGNSGNGSGKVTTPLVSTAEDLKSSQASTPAAPTVTPAPVVRPTPQAPALTPVVGEPKVAAPVALAAPVPPVSTSGSASSVSPTSASLLAAPTLPKLSTSGSSEVAIPKPVQPLLPSVLGTPQLSNSASAGSAATAPARATPIQTPRLLKILEYNALGQPVTEKGAMAAEQPFDGIASDALVGEGVETESSEAPEVPLTDSKTTKPRHEAKKAGASKEGGGIGMMLPVGLGIAALLAAAGAFALRQES